MPYHYPDYPLPSPTAPAPDDIILGPPKTAFLSATSVRNAHKPSNSADRPLGDRYDFRKSYERATGHTREGRNNSLRSKRAEGYQDNDGWRTVKRRKSFGSEGAERFNGRLGVDRHKDDPGPSNGKSAPITVPSISDHLGLINATSVSAVFSDQLEQNWISETVAKRLGLPKDEDGKVSLTSLYPGRGNTSTAKFVARGPDDTQPAPSEPSAERSTGKPTMVYSLGDSVMFKRKISGSETDDHEWIRGSVVKVIGEGKSRRYAIENQHKSAIYTCPASQMAPVYSLAHIEHTTKSEATSEEQDHYDEDDNRSSSSSTRSKPQSRDITPSQGLLEANGIPTELTDREKRKLALVEDSFREMEQSQLPRKKMRADHQRPASQQKPKPGEMTPEELLKREEHLNRQRQLWLGTEDLKKKKRVTAQGANVSRLDNDDSSVLGRYPDTNVRKRVAGPFTATPPLPFSLAATDSNVWSTGFSPLSKVSTVSRYTISEDNTQGDNARNSALLAALGKRMRCSIQRDTVLLWSSAFPSQNGTPPGMRPSSEMGMESATMMGDEHKPFRCPVYGCEKAYKNENGLKYHKTHGHQTQQLHENRDGTFSIVNPETLTPYPGTLGMEKENPHKCEVCGKRYKNLNGLKYHKQHSPCNPELKLNSHMAAVGLGGRNKPSGEFAMGSFGAVGGGKTLPRGKTSAERVAMASNMIPRPATNPMTFFNRPDLDINIGYPRHWRGDEAEMRDFVQDFPRSPPGI